MIEFILGSWEQFAIVFFGVVAVWLSQDTRYHVRKYSCLFGMAGEPFWLYSALKADQWGIVILVFVYGLGWSKGIWNYWIKPRFENG